MDEFGRTKLHYAASDGDTLLVNKLVAQGYDPKLPDQNQWTPLHFAAQASSVGVAQALLVAKIPVDPLDKHGNTPLSTAVFNSKGEGGLIKL